MDALVHDAGRGGPAAAVALICASAALLAVGVVGGVSSPILGVLVVLATIVALTRPGFIGMAADPRWAGHGVLFIPIRRYSLPGNLPFELEPYRIYVAVIVVDSGGRRCSSIAAPGCSERDSRDHPHDQRRRGSLDHRESEPYGGERGHGEQVAHVPAELRAARVRGLERRPRTTGGPNIS